MREFKMQPATAGQPASLFLPSPTSPLCSSSSSSSSTPTAAAAAAPQRQRRGLIFFIPGNPGLIDYYVPFLSHIRQLLDEAEEKTASSSGGGGGDDDGRMAFDIFGTSLAGFDDADHAEPFCMPGNPPHDVEHQVGLVAGLVAERDALLSSSLSLSSSSRGYDAVVLMGHSLGTYLACEVLHRDLVARRGKGPRGGGHGHGQQLQRRPRLRAGVLLMPTIVHIALSPSGRRLDAVRRSPALGRYAHVAAAALLAPWPAWLLRLFLARVWGMAPHGADATARWLKGRDGVWQALHMGKDEMAVIAEDRWEQDGFWGGGGGGGVVEEAVLEAVEAVEEEEEEEEEEKEQQVDRQDQQPPKFYMFYGKDDHWISNEVRDKFIAARHAADQGREGGAKITLDESGVIPHDFCINYSEPVAERVKVWLDELAEQL